MANLGLNTTPLFFQATSVLGGNGILNQGNISQIPIVGASSVPLSLSGNILTGAPSLPTAQTMSPLPLVLMMLNLLLQLMGRVNTGSGAGSSIVLPQTGGDIVAGDAEQETSPLGAAYSVPLPQPAPIPYINVPSSLYPVAQPVPAPPSASTQVYADIPSGSESNDPYGGSGSSVPAPPEPPPAPVYGMPLPPPVLCPPPVPLPVPQPGPYSSTPPAEPEPEPTPPPAPYTGGTEGTVYGDPHFVGFDGEKYDVMGEAGKFYNILSDKNVQYNAKFVVAPEQDAGINLMGEAGVQVGSNRLFYTVDGSPPTLNGVPMTVGQRSSLGADAFALWDGLKLNVNTGEYTIRLSTGVDNGIVSDVSINPGGVFADGVKPHGLLGQTADGIAGAKVTKVDQGKQGGNVIDGTVTDYLVNDIWGTTRQFNRFVIP